MMKRQPDGTWRNTREAITVSDAVRRARWVEAETLSLKRMGLYSFETIAEQISRVGRHQAQALVEIPSGLAFPPDYTHQPPGLSQSLQKGLRTGAITRARRVPQARYRAGRRDVHESPAGDSQGQSTRD